MEEQKNKYCKAITKAGEPCNVKANNSGYCHIHDPVVIQKRQRAKQEAEKKKQETYKKGEKLRQVLDIIKSTCIAKSWDFKVINIDKKNWKYGRVEVSRSIRPQYTQEEVKGEFEITIDNGVKVLRHEISFRKHGLRDLHDAIINELGNLSWLKQTSNKKTKKKEQSLDIIIRILRKFHNMARQLRRRYDDRGTIIITDEYDVQDILHSILNLIFDDVRSEEYSPSYAGGSSRIDFLVKKEKVIIEVKMTNKTLKDKKIGEQLLIDIGRYKIHPDCKYLICFIYDPDGFLRNPSGLETDLTGKRDCIDVITIVNPK